MDYLLSYKKVSSEQVEIVRKYTNVKITKFGDFTQYTYYVKTEKKGTLQFEDAIFIKYPFLIDILPRGFSIVVGNDDSIISVLEGPHKFSGKTPIDEDPEDEEEEQKEICSIYNHSKIVEWANDLQLEIIATEKANGKFAILRMVPVEDILYFHVGSKNKHLFFPYEKIDYYISNSDTGDIISSILQDIKANIGYMTDSCLLSKFKEGYSLCGELCDGQHFVQGDNTVSWFGLFKQGLAMETIECFEFIKSVGLKTVDWTLVYDSSSNIETLENVFIDSRCKSNEGSVLRCRNTSSNEIILVKTKSASYITKRFLRQCVLKGYASFVDTLKKRFVDAQSYHGLGTNASIKMCNQLIKFGFWLMNNEYPVNVLGFMPVSSIRGELANGFCHYWTKFIDETKDTELVLTTDDFGPFDKNDFLSKTEPYEVRNYINSATVIFMQGLQGSGKSTIGNHVKEQLEKEGNTVTIVEQDRFYGCTLSCQGYLYHSIKNANGPNVIIVTRCNANPTQYNKYLQICHKLPSIVSFVSPSSFNELYLAICLCGVMNRKSSGDKLLVGRKEYDIAEALQFIGKLYSEFQEHKSSFKLDLHSQNSELLEQARTLFSETTKTNDYTKFITWITENKDTLQSLRHPVCAIGTQLIQYIHDTQRGVNIVSTENPIYIGLFVQERTKQDLIEFIRENNHIINYEKSNTFVCHCTQVFFGGKQTLKKNVYCNPLDRVNALIDALVIRKSDGACCFRIVKETLISGEKQIVMKDNPHITGIIPDGTKPVISNQFVGLTDDSVIIIPMHYELEMICHYV